MAGNLTEEGREKIKRELQKKAVRIVQDSKRRAPVDTGRLRSSITFETVDLPGRLPKVLIGSNVEYAPHVEFGTVNQPPQPYLRPALRKFTTD